MSNPNPDWKNYKRSLGTKPEEHRETIYSSPPKKSRLQFFIKFTFFILIVLFVCYESVPSDFGSSFGRILAPTYEALPLEGPYYFYAQTEIPLTAFSDSLSTSEKATIQVSLSSGQTMEALLSDLGFSSDIIVPVTEALTKFREESNGKVNLKAGAKIGISFDLKDGIEEIVVEIDSSSELKIVRQSPGIYKARILSFSSITKERIVVGSIDSSFASSATKQGLSYDMIDDLVDIFSDRVSFHRDFQKGDRFTLIFHEHEVRDGGKTVPGPILGAALEVKGQHLVALRYVGIDGKARYFNEKGEEIGNTYLRFPLKFSKISSYFSTARFHPVLKIKRPHHGVDFSAPIGTPVRSIASGVIEFAGRKGGHGIILEVRHSDRFTTGYSHLSAISPGIKRGKRVNKGDVIGAVGMTGLATGPHLHFSLYDRGVYVDPLKTDLPLADDPGRGNRVDERYLKRALFTLEHYQNVASNTILQNKP
jgi:murein DD-endopeptidase MepM/ murein hydrolase activator NlpD